MKKQILLVVILFCPLVNLFAQVSIGNGNHVMEIGGTVSMFYNHRFMKTGENDKKRNRFGLRDAQIQIEGRIKNTWEYELQMDFADLISADTDPENPGLMDAYFVYKGLRFIDIKAGYSKIGYSRGTQIPFIFSPWWQRSELIRGNLFSMRDVGVSLMKTFWKQRVNIQAGVYTGQGEVTLKGFNDASGQPEYAGRIDVSFPSRFRYQGIDTRHVPVPMFSVGFNGRYANKKLPAGTTFPSGSGGEFGFKVLDGEKFVYGLDAAFMFKGISALFEIHQIKGTPTNSASAFLQGLPKDKTKGYFLAGGWFAELNYHLKPARSVFALRFEELNLNDLAAGKAQRISGAYCYMLNGYNSMLKIQYVHILEEETIDPQKFIDQVRVGWQVLFR